jgi:eukaryotic-like serine/threonine-protein kinase
VNLHWERLLRDALTAAGGQRLIAGGRNYTLGGILGHGAIGVVRRATDEQTGAAVAIKFLAPELKYIEEGSLEDIRARFEREGLRGISLEHENLVKVLAYEENQNGANFLEDEGPCNPFIVMDYIQGRTLEHFIQKIRTGTPTFNVKPQTLHIAYCVAKTLVYLHDRAIVHRDVKPANIYITRVSGNNKPGVVKLGDFGVVKWGDFKASISTGTLTVSGQQGLGTLKYMSPEQALKPKDVNVRSDMYSFGVTLFELLTMQILPSPVHVYQMTIQRLRHGGTTVGNLHELGLGIVPGEFEDLFSDIYDMFLTGPSGRPSSTQMRGKLSYLLEKLEDTR